MLGIIEVHVDRPHFYDRPRYLRTEMQRNSFVRLDMDLDPVRPKTFYRSFAKQDERRLLELNNNARPMLSHPLAGTEIERNIGPSPIVNVKLQRGIGFGTRLL